MKKPIRHAVAVVVRRGADGHILAVRRPPDDEELPNVWGLPAISMLPAETPEAAAIRVGREKLGVELATVNRIGVLSADRGAFELILMDIEASVVSGEPDVTRATSNATRYVEQRWIDSVDLLREGARKGSLCCQILIDSLDRRG